MLNFFERADQMASTRTAFSKPSGKPVNSCSPKNLLKPADGEPIISPSKDMVLGVYYLTKTTSASQGEGRVFADMDEAELAYQLKHVDIHTKYAWGKDLV